MSDSLRGQCIYKAAYRDHLGQRPRTTRLSDFAIRKPVSKSMSRKRVPRSIRLSGKRTFNFAYAMAAFVQSGRQQSDEERQKLGRELPVSGRTAPRNENWRLNDDKGSISEGDIRCQRGRPDRCDSPSSQGQEEDADVRCPKSGLKTFRSPLRLSR